MWKNISSKKIKILALAVSFPSLIFLSSLFLMNLVEKNILDKDIALWIFMAIIFNSLITMVVFAFKNKS